MGTDKLEVKPGVLIGKGMPPTYELNISGAVPESTVNKVAKVLPGIKYMRIDLGGSYVPGEREFNSRLDLTLGFGGSSESKSKNKPK